MTAALVVERPGLLTTVQDAGRWGWQHLGVSVSGWMDEWSPRLANRLVGNDEGTATLEITLIGPTLVAEAPLVVAVAGAVFDVTVGGRVLRSPFVAPVGPRESIAFGARHAGTRAYLAVRGGIETPRVLGSQSMDLRAALGGHRLNRGDTVGVVWAPALPARARELDAPAWLFAPRLRILPGPDDGAWADGALETLAAGEYRVASASDRTGYRLEGPPLPPVSGAMPSAPVAAGTLQVPPSGQPILLMADCQTTGGYARLGVLASADGPVAGQLGPGDACRFERCAWQDASLALEARRRSLEQMVESAR